jgi:hypothetical protein
MVETLWPTICGFMRSPLLPSESTVVSSPARQEVQGTLSYDATFKEMAFLQRAAQ